MTRTAFVRYSSFDSTIRAARHSILAPRPNGGYTVSVRVPAGSRVTTDEFCCDFETGGGRKLALGINPLPPADVDRLATGFEARFRKR